MARLVWTENGAYQETGSRVVWGRDGAHQESVSATSYSLAIGAGTFVLTGEAAGLTEQRRVAAGLGTFTLTGEAAGTIAGRKVSAGLGTFALSGQVVSLQPGKRVAAAVGGFSLTGEAVGLLFGGLISAQFGDFRLTVVFGDVAPSGAAVPLLPARRAMGLVGRAARLRMRRPLSSFIPPAPPTITRRPQFPPAPTGGVVPRTLADAASLRHVRLVIDVVNNILHGALNITLPVTLTANAAATTITDARISATSALLLTPLTANAAAEQAAGTLYVSSQTKGSAVVAHANNSQDDRAYTLVIIG